MRYLGIDPGTFESGLVLFNTEGPGIEYADSITNALVRSIISQQRPDIVVIELISSYGMPVGAETFQTVLFSGRIQEFCRIYKIPCVFYTRFRVRCVLCKTGNAGDSNISRALLDRFGYWGHGKTGKGTKEHPGLLYGISSHALAALAVVIAAIESPEYRRTEALTIEEDAEKRDKKIKKREKSRAKKAAISTDNNGVQSETTAR